jgi:hypothetical protein
MSAGFALVPLLIGLGYAVVFVPLGYLMGGDAMRHGPDGWLWGILFVGQPVIVGLIYLTVRRHPPRQRLAAPPGWYPNPDPAATADLRWWDGSSWGDQVPDHT